MRRESMGRARRGEGSDDGGAEGRGSEMLRLGWSRAVGRREAGVQSLERRRYCRARGRAERCSPDGDEQMAAMMTAPVTRRDF